MSETWLVVNFVIVGVMLLLNLIQSLVLRAMAKDLLGITKLLVERK